MVEKSYEQYCGVAVALDLVGDRWTLLILRELSYGPQRFTDLRRGLPGIATNLLADRLRALTQAHLIEQRDLPPPVARAIYELTENGKRIRPVLAALARFGLPLLVDPVEGKVRPAMAVYGAVAANFDLARAGCDLLMRFELDGEEHWLQVRGGKFVRADRRSCPDLTFTGSAAALLEVCRGTAALDDVASRLRVEGRASAKRAFAQVFTIPRPQALAERNHRA